jgi:hypothetical protein
MQKDVKFMTSEARKSFRINRSVKKTTQNKLEKRAENAQKRPNEAKEWP